ncbi:MAG: protein-L-isoaspartate O-methyltransferase [Acidiferrobacterales bacterium]
MGQVDFEVARHTMVEQQVRTWEVLDQRVLDLIAASPREHYVPEQYRNLAYVDMNIPLGHHQVMMSPKLEARLLQEAAIGAGDKVLEIGTGSGYMTSLAAALAGHVYSVEIIPELAKHAQEKLTAHAIDNVTVDIGDGARGWDKHAPYDVTLITGSLPLPPESFKNALAPGGRLVAIVGNAPAMDALLLRRLNDESWTIVSLFETVLPPLINAEQPDKFVF